MTAPLRPVALVVGPWKDATPEDHARMDEVLRVLVDRGWAPVFYPRSFMRPGAWYPDDDPRHGETMVLQDSVPAQRTAALECSTALVQALAESRYPVALVVVPSHRKLPSPGMRNDLDQWQSAGRTLEQMWLGLDLPARLSDLDALRDRLLSEHAQREAVLARAREALEELLR